MNDMFFDTSSFDFDSLTDVVGLNGNDGNPTRLNEQPTVRTEDDDISDLIGSLNGEHEQDEVDFNDDASDLKRKDITSERNITDYFNASPDDAILEYDGLRLSKAETKDLFKKAKDVERDHAYLQELASKANEHINILNSRRFMQNTVLETNIMRLQGYLNNPNITDAEHRQYTKDLANAQAHQKMFLDEVNKTMNDHARYEEQQNDFRLRLADQLMEQNIPQWNQFRDSVWNYAGSLGFTENQMKKIGDTPLFTALYKAMLYDHNRKTVSEASDKRANEVKNPRSTVGAKQSSRNNSLSDIDKAKANNAIKNMGSTRQANVDAFKYLKD
ncbi:hypothetical protein K3712_000542 [Escherichia coli]|nr:hypothetical protein [Escherichia coli]